MSMDAYNYRFDKVMAEVKNKKRCDVSYPRQHHRHEELHGAVATGGILLRHLPCSGQAQTPAQAI